MVSEKMKFGSFGEYEIKEISKRIPSNKTTKPSISINLFTVKSKAVLTIFFIFILDESNISLCII